MQRQRPQRAAAVAANAGLSFDGTGPNPAVAPPPQSSVWGNAPDADVDERPVLELPQELEVVKTHIETLLSELGEGEMMTSAEIRDAVLQASLDQLQSQELLKAVTVRGADSGRSDVSESWVGATIVSEWSSCHW